MGLDYFRGLLTRITFGPFLSGTIPRRTFASPVTLPDLLTDLTDLEKPVTYSGLLQLSDLPVEGLTVLKTVWSNLPTERRRETVRKLIELADDNVEFDFSSIFKSCLTDGDDAIREMAAKGLWEAEDRALIRPLVKLLETDTCAEVRASAAMSLKNFAVMAAERQVALPDGDRIRRALLAVANRRRRTSTCEGGRSRR